MIEIQIRGTCRVHMLQGYRDVDDSGFRVRSSLEACSNSIWAFASAVV